ncbi:leucine-rich repeat receptor-like serine/threonine-protein kinase At1g17230 [Cornus florida]|uniref:leucine-rich repeat receptor-like serine/threonine-protein kinase At1g17230 n=1 Tax=Cornus florida TaxID=4283 RepID=UPI0028985B5B|nr:leucine-rich repeat receptor-like serine/threonine-protein kinase At1g17230 [Cornus florida]
MNFQHNPEDRTRKIPPTFSLKPNMGIFSLYLLSLFFFVLTHPSPALSEPTASEHSLLMTIKASLDPHNLYLSSWSPNASVDPCDGSFEGVACNELGHVVNISLQGKGLSGKIPQEIGRLESLSGLYLHFNLLYGVVPKEIANLRELSDLYLNVNNLSGEVPPEIANMSNLQVLQLCYNKFTGSIPTQLGSLKKLGVLALQYNQLTGAIPASLGDLEMLKRLDLSFNRLFGSIPVKLADPPMLEILDIRNNTLSGNVPPALKRLNERFQYANNKGLCGVDFSSLEVCTDDDNTNPDKPEPFGPGLNGRTTKNIPESANFQPNCTQTNCSNRSKPPQIALICVAVGVIVALTVTGLLTFSWYRRRKQKIGSAFDTSNGRLSTDQLKEVYKKSASPLINLEYSNGWDPMAKGRSGDGFSQEVFESFMFNVEDVESATQYFSEVNLLGKSSFSAIYKGILRDGSVVAVKCIAKTSCKSDEADFLKGLKVLISLKHENLVRLRGFCCSKGRGECFLIYDFVPNGNLLQYLDVKDGKGKGLEWSTRTSIIKGIAKGIEYLHGNKGNKPALVHQNISAEKVLIDQRYNPLLSDSGLQKLLVNDIVFSTVKTSAAMGYLAPEYTTTGRFTEKSDIFAFGMIIFQILCGKRRISPLTRQGAESGRFEDFIDPKLEANFSESEAAKLGKIALLCTHESPNQRPAIEMLMQELSDLRSNS